MNRNLVRLLGAVVLGTGVLLSGCGGSGNSPPEIGTLTATPSTAPYLAPVSLSGTATDPEDGNLSSRIRWSSNRDGSLGSGATISRSNLSVGTHTITASVTDSDGATDTSSTTVTVTNTAPIVSAAGQPGRVFVGTPVELTGSASDAEEGSLSGSLQWSSSLSGALGTGASIQATLAAGQHVITASATDSVGATGTRTFSIVVDSRPNILFILADDLGAESSAMYPQLAGDAGQAPAPNLQALASQGITFDNVWVNPVCSPTRAQILTGLYGNRTGVLYAGDVLPTTFTSIFQYITASSPASYGMGVFGKWHLGNNAQHVHDTGVPRFKGIISGGVSDYFNWNMTDINGVVTNVTTYSTTAITDYAIEFLNNHRATRPTDPWFMYVPYNAPHGVFASTGFQVPPANLHSVDVGGLAPGTVSDTIPVYQAMVQALDTEIGRLLNAIGPVGSPERDNTIIIFMGDNGTPQFVKDPTSKITGYKTQIFEGGVRVPLVISGAGVGRQNQREGKLVVGADLFPTIASLAGIQTPQNNDGRNIVPLLSSTSASTGRTFLFSEYCQVTGAVSRFRNAGVRGDRYKLSYGGAISSDGTASGTWRLFDLQVDPLEQTNLYNDAMLSSERATLEAQFAQVKLGDTTGCLP